MIHYTLFENNLTSDPTDYRATVQPVGRAELEDVIERIIQRGSTVSKSDILSVLEEYHHAIESLLLDGLNVVTPSANYSVSVRGVFNGQADRFDPSRHQVTATVNPGVRLRRAIRERAQVIKQEATRPTPNPLEFTDMNSGERNSLLTPGGIGQVVGHRLKFDPTDANQGIFLIAEDGSVTQVTVVARNMPSELTFLIPANLAAGDYTLEVRADFSGDLRTGALDATLTVT